MNCEEDPSHNGDDGGTKHNEQAQHDRKREAKENCLKIKGQDGYMFQSCRVTPHTTNSKTDIILSETLAKEPSSVSSSSETMSEEQPSQGDEQLSKPQATGEQNFPASPAISTDTPAAESALENHSQHTENETDAHISEEEPNNMEDVENFAFDNPLGSLAPRENEDYGNLLSYTLYDVAMDAVTQSLLSSMRNPVNPRKKSPAWNHFFISPRNSTKAICMYCMKEFSRGKNEKDLSTSCLMRHVRRAHPSVLSRDTEFPNGVPASMVPPGSSPNNADLATSANSAQQNTTSTLCSMEAVPKEDLPVTPKFDKSTKNDISNASSPHSSNNNNHNEEALEGMSDRILTTPKSSNSRRRSAVWKHFYLSPADNSKAVCVHCMNEFSRGKNGKDLGTSCLIRHMWRAHRDIVIEENNQGSNIPPPYTAPPTLLPRLQLQETTEFKKESPFLSSSPETVPDEVATSFIENMEVKEDSSDELYQSGQESSLDISLDHAGDMEQYQASAPDDLSEGSSLNHNLTGVFQQNKKIMKRVKSEVWHHFVVSPVDQLKALCRYCTCIISRGKRGDFGTSCLMRHLVRRHPDVLKNQKSTDDKESMPCSPYSLTPADASMVTNGLAGQKKLHSLPVFSKKTSKLWNHFSISETDPTKVVCLHCNRTISRGKKTTNLGTSCLFRHMQRFHGHALEISSSISGDATSAEIQVKQELLDTSSYEGNHEKFDELHPVAKKITRLVAEMLALDLQPATLVENVGLGRLLDYLQPQYSLPSSSYFANTAIPHMYEQVKDVVVTHLKEAEGGIIHFTASIWISSQTKEYLTLTAHWVAYESRVRPQGQDFHCSALLSVSQIDCDYNTMNIQKQLEYLWDTWICSSGLKIGFTVTDNLSIGNTLDDNDHATVQCFGHTIDLIVNEAIKSQRMVQNLLSIARKICERVHRSQKAKEKLAELQRVHGLPENQLVQDIPSKWKTSLYMLERLVEQKKAMDEMSVECNFREMISCDQWEVMQSVCNALKPFEVACREMSSRTATLGQVIPLVHILTRKIDLLFDETMGIDNMLKSLKDAMVSRMSPTLHDPRYTCATMLDPRYKTSLFTDEEAEQCKQDLLQELETSIPTSGDAKPVLPNGCDKVTPSSGSSSKENLWALMDDIRSKIKQEERPKSSEMALLEYLEEEILDQSCDPLDYWNLKRFLWPELAQVAVRYVACPPSIVPVETLCSTASASCTASQSRQLDNLEGLIFLKANLPLIYFQY